MKIKEEYKVRDIAGEHVVIMQGRYGADMTKVISLNDSSLMLWNALQNSDFDASDAARLLCEAYGIDEATAMRDAEAWIAQLRDCRLLGE